MFRLSTYRRNLKKQTSSLLAFIFYWLFIFLRNFVFLLFVIFLHFLMLHFEMCFICLLISEEFGAFFTAFKVWLFFLLFSSVLFLTHNDLNYKSMISQILYFFKQSTIHDMDKRDHFPPTASFLNYSTPYLLTSCSNMKSYICCLVTKCRSFSKIFLPSLLIVARGYIERLSGFTQGLQEN